MKKILVLACAMLFAFSLNLSAQVRPIEKSKEQTAPKKPAPASFAAKYEGGMFGFSKREEGVLKFEDVNERIVFYGEDKKEMFSIPYKSMLVVYPQSKSVTSTTGNVIRNIPLPGAILGGFIKEKRRYLVINYDDPDVDAKGTVNFKLEDKDLLDSVIHALGEKAKLSQRGDAYYRPRNTAQTDN